MVAGRLPDLTAGESRCLPNLRGYPRRNGEREIHMFLTDHSYFPASITPASKPRTKLPEHARIANRRVRRLSRRIRVPGSCPQIEFQ